MYVSVAVCLHLNKSICSTCTYEWVWKPYSDVNAGCACASYSLSYVTFVWWEENTFCLSSGYLSLCLSNFPGLLWRWPLFPYSSVLLLLFLGFPFYIVMYRLPVLFLLAVYVLNYSSVQIQNALSMQCCTNATTCVAILSFYWSVSLLFDSLSEIHHKVSLIPTLL